MAIFPDYNKYTGRVPVFWVEPSKVEIFGYKLSQRFAKGTVIKQGTPLVADAENRTAAICKIARVVSKVSTTKFNIAKGHHLSQGDKVFCSGESAPTLSTINSIDTTSPDYDLITLASANTQLGPDSILVEGRTGDASSVVPVALPNRLVARECVIRGLADTISACYSAVAIETTLHMPVEYLNLTAFPGSRLLVGCPTISFVRQ